LQRWAATSSPVGCRPPPELGYGWGMSTPPDSSIIRIAAAVLVREDGQVLVVRKAGTSTFMQPGGKLEPGETAEAALLRELGEELLISGTLGQPEWLGHFDAPAANEPGATVIADAFVLTVTGAITPQAEIEEIRWIDPAAPGGIKLAQLSRTRILPAYLAQRQD
jgi:8-oxo-dGTP diphosphatase